MTSPTDPDDTQAWHAQRDALRSLHRNVLDEAVPPAMLQTLARASDRQDVRQRWTRWSAVAVSVALAFGGGWLASGQWSARHAPQGTQARAFMHDAVLAHVVYSPEKRHPVEVVAAEQQHLVQWLSRRLDRPLKVPDLSALGYSLVGGRLLPGEQGARAQFMFEDAKGQRVTLYIGAMSQLAAASPNAKPANETAFRFASDGPVPSFYWIDRGFGYALAGNLPRETLLAIATAVYPQI